MKKRRRREGWKKPSMIIVTLTAAISLYQQAEHAIVTTAHDINSFVSSPDPLTYARLEAYRVKPEWETPRGKRGNFPDLP
jgi:hypothetical protein